MLDGMHEECGVFGISYKLSFWMFNEDNTIYTSAFFKSLLSFTSDTPTYLSIA